MKGRVVPLEQVQQFVDGFNGEFVEAHRVSKFFVSNEHNRIADGVVFAIK